MDKSTEVRLAGQACHGDREAFGLLERPCLPGLNRRALALYNDNHARADDNVQETRVRAWKHICQFQGKASFCSWMHRISRNLFLDENSKDKRHPTISLDAPISVESDSGSLQDFQEDDGLGPEELAIQHQFCADLNECLDECTFRERKIFHLYWCIGLTLVQIAQINGISSSRAQQILVTVYIKMGNCMKKKHWDSPEEQQLHCLCGSSEATNEVIR